MRQLVIAVLLGLLATVVTWGAPCPASAGVSNPRSLPAGSLLSLALQQAELTAADGVAHDLFGCSVALSGDTAVVGARLHQVGSHLSEGAVYVFTRAGGGWLQEAQLLDGDHGAQGFGSVVAISGDTILAATSTDWVGPVLHQGSVSVFVRGANGWEEQAQLVRPEALDLDYFGRAIALDGDTAVVGDPYDDAGVGGSEGSAFVYVRTDGVWLQQARLKATDAALGDEFGTSVAIVGETALVGAPGKDNGQDNERGAAYIFVRSGDVWSQQARLEPHDPPAQPNSSSDRYGYSVAMSGGIAVVGAPMDIIGPHAEQGSAYVFVVKNGVWSQQARLIAVDGQEYDHFGMAVAVDGETVVIGAPLDDFGPPVATSWQGSVYAFTRSGGVWSQQVKLRAADGASVDSLGAGQVAISGDTVLAGALNHDVGGSVDQGSAYVFVITSPGRPTPTSPRGAISSRTPTFRWAAAARASAYELRVYKGHTLIRGKTGVATTWWKWSRRLPRQVWLTWKIRAVSSSGPGVWSSTRRFRVK